MRLSRLFKKKRSRIIEKWSEKETSGSLVLPDGWFGRPYDNRHWLTEIDESAEGLSLVLDRNLKLQFAGLKNVHVDGNDLIFGPFDGLLFEYTPYGPGEHVRRSRKYDAGEVKIVASP